MAAKTRTQSLPPESEEAFLKAVIQLARLQGWRVAHFRPARTARGWRTAVQGDGKGFPDLVLVKGGRLIFMELKRNGGKASPEQLAWLEALAQATPEVYLFWVQDWEEIVRVLLSREEQP